MAGGTEKARILVARPIESPSGGWSPFADSQFPPRLSDNLSDSLGVDGRGAETLSGSLRSGALEGKLKCVQIRRAGSDKKPNRAAVLKHHHFSILLQPIEDRRGVLPKLRDTHELHDASLLK